MLEIVVVEDHDILREELVHNLNHPDWRVRGVYSGIALDAVLLEQAADILILDLNLPGEDGLSIARRMRATSRILGIVIMTARQRPGDRSIGYELGVDVFINKPAQIGELKSIIANLSYRINADKATQFQLKGRYTLNVSLGILRKSEALWLNLTPSETQLFYIPLCAPNRQISTEDLLKKLAEQGETYTRANLVTKVSRLRDKLRKQFNESDLLQSVYGFGYKIEANVQLEDGGADKVMAQSLPRLG